MEPKHWTAATVLVLLWLAETWLPFFRQLHGNLRERLVHDARNLAWGAINSLLAAVAMSTVFVGLDGWAQARQFGLLRQWELPTPWLATLLAVVLMDVWTYWWHRFNHIVPLFWRFHRTHHSDLAMDVSSAVRFHTGELLLSWTARVAVVPLLGVSLVQLAFYEGLLLPVVLFHHSNLRLPRWLDFGLLAVVVTPAMHRVHHSRVPAETNSNYSSLLPWWDVVFGSLRLRRDVENIQYGLDQLTDPRWQTFGGMLRTPLAQDETMDSTSLADGR